eukprot:TRINITY_DN22644_c0_g1_i1.p1 TRINITY_DN22644_c0_g1~~TRINITY_DN22644_c0_g1_i1.p1  ORF type:complete len:467 (+),score=113.11 TRINITY_DN22644_c0_g1_i1:197-1402(+)
MVVAWASPVSEPSGYAKVGPGVAPSGAVPCKASLPQVSADFYAMNTSADRTTYLYHARLASLSAGQTYHYCVGFEGSGETLPVTFTVRAQPGSTATRAVIFGDSGDNRMWSNGTVPTVRSEVLNGTVDVVLHTGDMAYYAKDKDGQQGDIHAQEISDLTASSVPFMAVPGNGEVFCYRPEGIPKWAACMEDYQMRYIMPGYADAHSLWHSFDLGLGHYLMLDSEALLWCGATQSQPDQLAFMEADLKKAVANRGAVPWIFVVVHRPLYSSCNSTAEQQSMRDGFYGLVEEYNVDVVFNGHVHSYERTFPVTGDYSITSNATVDLQDAIHYKSPKYPVHIVTGAAGNGESIDKFSTYNWSFSAFRSLDIGYTRMLVANSSVLEIDFFSVTQGRVIDAFVMEK